MCGRYTLSKKDKLAEMLRERFLFEEFSELRITPRFNIAPTQQVPIVLQRETRKLVYARWGLVPFWAKDDKQSANLIHARAESVATTPAFRNAYQQRRCLVPADGFYEWQKTGFGKIPHHFTLKDDALFAFAGMWESWRDPKGEEIRSVALITTTPNSVVAPVHDRMPVILTPGHEAAWLDQSTPLDSLASMLAPYPSYQMKAVAVSSAVNNSRLDSPELLNPLPTGGEFRLEA